MYMQEISFGTF